MIFIINLTLTHLHHKDVAYLSAADGFLKTCKQKKKLIKTSNLSYCHHVFNSIQLLHFHLQGVSKRIWVCFQSHLLQICCMWEKVNKSAADKALYANLLKIPLNESIINQHYYRFLLNPFPHTTILQQTTLNIFCQNIGSN